MPIPTYKPRTAQSPVHPPQPKSPRRGRGFMSWCRSVRDEIVDGWKMARDVRPEDWASTAQEGSRRLSARGYSEGLSMLVNRCRWDVGFRRTCLMVLILTLLFVPLPLSLVALQVSAWVAMPS